MLFLQAAAIAAAMAVGLLLLVLPQLASQSVTPGGFGLVVLAAAVLATVFGGWLLTRAVATPFERLLDAAASLSGTDGLPLLGEGTGLARAAVAFERVALALQQEQRALASKVEALTRADRALDQAQASLARSERLATVGRLAAGLAHEIGNPLGAISGYAEIARLRLPAASDPDLVTAVARVAEAAARIDRTIRDLLDFASPSEPRLAAVPLGRAIEATERLARVQARFRHVELVRRLDPALPPVLADEHQLTQVLLNLLLNAGDAMSGQGRVVVSASLEPDGAAVALEVADSGPGIHPEHLPHLFDPFFTTKGPGEGTGLGLAISHRIVESLGGALTAGNGAEGGAVFRLRLPAASPAAGGPGTAW